MNEKSIPGWTIYIDEISNGVFKVTLTDTFGRKAEVVDAATEETIERAVSDAFDIEKQISKNWNLFLYELVNQKLSDVDIQQKEYKDEVFGSWVIEKKERRLVYDGKECWLTLQAKTNAGWTDIESIKKDELQYSSLVKQINRFKENAPLT